MSKRSGIWRISVPLSAGLDKCKQKVRRYWRVAGGIVSSLSQRLDLFEVERWAKANHPSQKACGQGSMELQEFIKVLSIGDRIRVLCDDGVLVAEKISQNQFKLIECRAASKLIH